MILLSFDSDHLDEARMEEFLKTVTFPGKGTFFCTQKYESLLNTGHELAPHPYLDKNDWDKELKHMREAFPQAIGWRAHSCVFSHILAIWLKDNNYRYVSTHENFGANDIQAHKHLWGIWHLPIYYMDNMDFSRHLYWKDNVGEKFSKQLLVNAVNGKSLYIFDFHPIHLMLNTPGPEYYFQHRDDFKAGKPIEEIRYQGYGTMNYFTELCELMKIKGMESQTMGALVQSLENDTLRKQLNVSS